MGISWRLAGIVAALAVAACATDAPATPAMTYDLPQAAVCPTAAPADTRCYTGQSAEGAFFWIAIPADWNKVLVVHAHGGPRMSAPGPDDPVQDLERFKVTLTEGYAWAGSSYRRAGYGVRMAAEDTDRLRQIFWSRFGRPDRTLLHGQSWGANVAAKAAELYAIGIDGQAAYDGVVLTNGVLAGGTRAYQFRADLRAVYQYYCRNHPGAAEAPYPVWQGLPVDAEMTRVDVARRVEACTGVNVAADQRSSAQTAALRNILAVAGIREDQLVAHMTWATVVFQDIVWRMLQGGNPFSNVGTRYKGSDDDEALNDGVERFTAAPEAVARLAYDSDLSGLIVAPTLTLHAKFDPTAFVWHEAAYRDVIARAGRSDLLVQMFTEEDSHSQLSTAEYAAVFAAMTRWVSTGERPTPQTIANDCLRLSVRYGEPCLFDLDFAPASEGRLTRP